MVAKQGKQGKQNSIASIDGELVAGALKKIMEGRRDDLTREERSAVRRHEKEKEERLRWQFYNAIPQKHWRQMSGRQTKVINEQAERHGIPFGGANISLPAVVRALHDFLADNKYKLTRDDDPLMVGGSSPALERYREERALLAKLDRREREAELLPRDEVRQSLAKMASVLRGAGETLQRQFGQAAADILNEALDDTEHEINRFFGGEPDEDPRDAT